jgi:hypothetical protein
VSAKKKGKKNNGKKKKVQKRIKNISALLFVCKRVAFTHTAVCRAYINNKLKESPRSEIRSSSAKKKARALVLLQEKGAAVYITVIGSLRFHENRGDRSSSSSGGGG